LGASSSSPSRFNQVITSTYSSINVIALNVKVVAMGKGFESASTLFYDLMRDDHSCTVGVTALVS
jgi:hypothetical protein